MDKRAPKRVWTVVGTVVLALTVGIVARRSVKAPEAAPAPLLEEGMRDAVAAPMIVAAAPRSGWIANPAMMPSRPAARVDSRRPDQENALVAARLRKVARAAREKAAALRADAARQVTVE